MDVLIVQTVRVQGRLGSLDAFRGLTVASMVIVNNPGTWDAVYWPLDHAPWHGWTPTDLIFPFFLFIVGVSLTISRQTLNAPWWQLVRRAAVIAGLGLFMAAAPYFPWSRLRIPGVLQRIGICYLAAAVIFRGVHHAAPGPRSRALALVALVAAILIGYWVVLTRFGDLTPDGNAGARLDRLLLGQQHLWRRQTWDPEGVLSSAPAVATTLLGVLAGLWVRSSAAPHRKVWGLAGAGALLCVAGQVWHIWLPINKNMWTSSYVLLSAGAAAVIFAACIEAIDVRGVRGWSRPFVAFGTNALTLFVVSGLVGKLLIITSVPRAGGSSVPLQRLIYEWGFAWMAAPKNASLLYALVFLALMYLMCAGMERRGWFLKA